MWRAITGIGWWVGPLALVLSSAISPESASAQDPFADVAAVYEVDERTVDWSPVKGLIVTSHRVVRVNRTAGIDAGRIRIWDTFFQKLKSFQGEVRDTSGGTGP